MLSYKVISCSYWFCCKTYCYPIDEDDKHLPVLIKNFGHNPGFIKISLLDIPNIDPG